jgi:hypothetical protein
MTRSEALRKAALQRISEQEARIERQKELIAHLTAKGIGSASAERLLEAMGDTLNTLRASLSHYSDREAFPGFHEKRRPRPPFLNSH